MAELRIETRKPADAFCIWRALAGSELSRSQGGWLVAVTLDDSSLARALNALQQCLDDNSIPPVTVSVDHERYVMELRDS